jgi:hypothetical protein
MNPTKIYFQDLPLLSCGSTVGVGQARGLVPMWRGLSRTKRTEPTAVVHQSAWRQLN